MFFLLDLSFFVTIRTLVAKKKSRFLEIIGVGLIRRSVFRYRYSSTSTTFVVMITDASNSSLGTYDIWQGYEDTEEMKSWYDKWRFCYWSKGKLRSFRIVRISNVSDQRIRKDDNEGSSLTGLIFHSWKTIERASFPDSPDRLTDHFTVPATHLGLWKHFPESTSTGRSERRYCARSALVDRDPSSRDAGHCE